MPRTGSSRKRGQVRDVLAMHTEISGGASETEVNEFAVMPAGAWPVKPQTAVTPEGKQENILRSSVESATAVARFMTGCPGSRG